MLSRDAPASQACVEVIEPLRSPPAEPPKYSASIYRKTAPSVSKRKSLLTRQLHTSSGTESLTEDEGLSPQSHAMVRGLSESSNRSVPSNFELVSDNDLSSAGIRTASPSPPPQTDVTPGFGMPKKAALSAEPLILDHDTTGHDSDRMLETDLVRRRCITFACGNGALTKSPTKIETPISPTTSPVVQEPDKQEPLKRKCALTFACPMRASANSGGLFAYQPWKHTNSGNALRARAASPSHPPEPLPPLARSRSEDGTTPSPPLGAAARPHRDSDATVRVESPSSFRKMPMYVKRRTYSEDLGIGITEPPGTFHEFGPPTVDETWLDKVDTTRGALTISDTLYKENLIRRIGEEAEQEAREDEELYGGRRVSIKDATAVDKSGDIDQDEDEDDVNEDGDDEDEDEDDVMADKYHSQAVSDTGFDSDDEGGLGETDDADDGSEYEWWTPRSSDAMGVQPLSEGTRRPSRLRALSNSSLESTADDGEKLSIQGFLKARQLGTIRAIANSLPDSTDFVCGTLDEDRPLEQVFLSRLAQRRAARANSKLMHSVSGISASDMERDSSSRHDGTMSPRQLTSAHGSVSSRAVRSIASRHVSRDTSPRPSRSLHPSSSRATTRSPAPFPGRTKHGRSPAPQCRRFCNAPSRRVYSPSPRRYCEPCSPPETETETTEVSEARRFSDPGTPACPVFIQHEQRPAQDPKPRRTSSLPRGSSAILINKRELFFYDS